MGQSKLDSLIETLTSTVVGFALSYFAQAWYLDTMHIEISNSANAGLVGFMTVISLIRGFGLRRLFNWLERRKLCK